MTVGARLAVVLASAGSLWLACQASNIQSFVAGQYVASLGCVTPEYVIDVISSPPIDASCDAVCIVPPFDSGVYVSGQCAPFPPGDLVNPDSGLCVKALAAINHHDLCLDGAASNPFDAAPPPPPSDASAEAGDASGAADVVTVTDAVPE